MATTWAQPCPKPDSFDIVHEWVSKKAWRDGSLRMDWLDLVDRINRERMISCEEVSDALTSLLDQGIMKKTDDGFLVTEKFSETFRISGAAGPQRGSLPRSGELPSSRRGERSDPSTPFPGGSRRVSDNSVCTELTPQYLPEPQFPRSKCVVLCRETFPRLCRDAGIAVHPMQFSWVRLAACVRKWEQNYGVDLDFVRQMMVVFVTLPELRRSTRSPDLLFISRREKLVGLVRKQQHRTPTNTRSPGRYAGGPGQ